jgi:hypothetical protein
MIAIRIIIDTLMKAGLKPGISILIQESPKMNFFGQYEALIMFEQSL